MASFLSGGRGQGNRTLAAVAAVAVILILVSAVLLARGIRTGESVDVSRFASDRDPVNGAKSAKVTIQEFADFQCPACKQAQLPISSLFMKFGDDIKVEYENFPLPGHRWATPTALLGECAFAQSNDKFWSVGGLLYTRQEQWSESTSDGFVRTFAKEAGLDMPKFETCYKAPGTQKKVDEDLAEGAALNINSTPTFFVNGERFVGSDFEEFEALIKKKIGEDR